MRRHVLEALLDSHRPLGAYEIIERLAGMGVRRRSRSTARSIFCATTASSTASRAATPSSPACIITAATTSSSSSSASAAVPSARRPAATLRKRSRPPRERPDSRPRVRDRDCRHLRPLPRVMRSVACFAALPPVFVVAQKPPSIPLCACADRVGIELNSCSIPPNPARLIRSRSHSPSRFA